MLAFKPKDADIHVERQARDQARWLVRDHGSDAERVLANTLKRPNLSAADRYCYQLTQRELVHLRRVGRASLVDRLVELIGIANSRPIS